MSQKIHAILAWLLAGSITAATLISLFYYLSTRDPAKSLLTLAQEIAWICFPVLFALLAALIIARQPRNLIGWLLMLPAITLSSEPVINLLFPEMTPAMANNPLGWLLLWYTCWSWLLLIYPILMLLLLFPTGRPPSPRWRWVIVFALGMCAFLMVMTAFGEVFELENRPPVPNPIGFISSDWASEDFLMVWSMALILLTVLCAASVAVRYRRASAIEREQIKWLLYACGLFAAAFIPFVSTGNYSEGLSLDVFGLLFVLAAQAIPIAITIAILRYHLWDIDVIIRRTLVYSIVTVMLALLYLGSVVLLQEVLGRYIDTSSPLVTVISTLFIAALFTPLRRRSQSFIDRRFFRRKYNAEQTLSQFAVTARDETDLQALTVKLLEVTNDTLQPASIGLWIRQTRRLQPGKPETRL